MPKLDAFTADRLLGIPERRASARGAQIIDRVVTALASGLIDNANEPIYNIIVGLAMALHTMMGRLACECARLHDEEGFDQALRALEPPIAQLTALLADLKTPRHPSRAQVLDASRANRN